MKARYVHSASSPFVSKAEVARRRGLSRMAVYRLIERGVLPVDDHGRILRGDFERLQASFDGAVQ